MRRTIKRFRVHIVLAAGLLATALLAMWAVGSTRASSIRCVGNDLVIELTGYAPGELVTVVANGEALALATTDGYGNASVPVGGPNTWNGVRADGQTSLLSQALGSITCPNGSRETSGGVDPNYNARVSANDADTFNVYCFPNSTVDIWRAVPVPTQLGLFSVGELIASIQNGPVALPDADALDGFSYVSWTDDGRVMVSDPGNGAQKVFSLDECLVHVDTSTQEMFSGTTGTAGVPATMAYVVQPGDALARIARDYGTTLETILVLNPKYRDDPDSLQVGAEVLLPAGSAYNPPPKDYPVYVAGDGTHRVERGESLAYIASIYNVSLEALMAVNPETQDDPDFLRVWQVLKLPAGAYRDPTATVDPTNAPTSTATATLTVTPGPSPTLDPNAPTPTPTPSVTPVPSATPQTYTIVAGDTFSSIAYEFGITVEALLAANPQYDGPEAIIYADEVLVIPAPSP